MNRPMLKLASALAVMAVVAGCASRNNINEDEPSASPFGIARAALGQVVAQRQQAQAAPAPARSPQDMAAAALAATPAAFGLIDAVPRAIADPGTTALWEQALDRVQEGELSLAEFVTKQSAWMGKQVERCLGLTLTISGPPPAGKGARWKKKRRTGGSKAKATAKTGGAPPRARKPRVKPG